MRALTSNFAYKKYRSSISLGSSYKNLGYNAIINIDSGSVNFIMEIHDILRYLGYSIFPVIPNYPSIFYFSLQREDAVL